MAGIRCGGHSGFAVALMIDGGLRRGDFESARDDYGRALAIRDRVLGTGHPLYAEAQAGLATALAGTGESAEAIAAALQAPNRKSISRRRSAPCPSVSH